MNKHVSLIAIVLVLLVASGCSVAIKPAFVRRVWAPIKGNSFRVNGPEVAAGPFKDRPEAKCNGLMTINIPQDWDIKCGNHTEPYYYDLTWSGLYLELWGGHPGVERKRFVANGITEYLLPEVGSADEHCTYSYPYVRLNPEDIKPGENEFQFKCDTGNTFWAHYLVRQAAFQAGVKEDSPYIESHGLTDFDADLDVGDVTDETVNLSVKVKDKYADKIAYVAFQAFYDGFDENGDADTRDWHGFTKDRKPVAFAAVTADGELSAKWDLSMIPDQQDDVVVRAFIHFKGQSDDDELFYVTTPKKFKMPDREGATVVMCAASELPAPFWSRAGNAKEAVINIPDVDGEITDVRLDVLIWDGGAGYGDNPFTINSIPVKIDNGGKHEVVYTGIRLDPGVVKRGANVIRLLSDTKHHGLECLLPGPVLTVRFERH